MKNNISAVILAAGFSSRHTIFKPLAKYKGNYYIQHIITKLNKFCDDILIVDGFRRKLLETKLKDSLGTNFLQKNIKFVFNKNFANGMFSSMQTGANNIVKILSQNDLVLIHLVDQPHISENVYTKILAETNLHKADAFIPSYDMHAGHPIIVNKKVIDKIANASTDKTLRDILNKAKKHYVEVDDRNILKDIDTIND